MFERESENIFFLSLVQTGIIDQTVGLCLLVVGGKRG